uniref:Carboxylesterase type B domain-containing protein n=2 Tax=Guillardia theta TaxID=55529 RepID=A0A7S4KKE2_GUITH|mmetsp:Transcript_26289/g.86389  ORF Transcript_26289/g.86389 Transcript_26289/m.86389 type:complete len:942 (+) Transcript_26289:112-2937(+)
MEQYRRSLSLVCIAAVSVACLLFLVFPQEKVKNEELSLRTALLQLSHAARAKQRASKQALLEDSADKDLSVAAAIKGAVGSRSEEGADLVKNEPDVDLDAIKKVQEEIQQQADQEIDAAVSTAKDAAQVSYQQSRSKFMEMEKNNPNAATDGSVEIYPPEGSPDRPVGYARKASRPLLQIRRAVSTREPPGLKGTRMQSKTSILHEHDLRPSSLASDSRIQELMRRASALQEKGRGKGAGERKEIEQQLLMIKDSMEKRLEEIEKDLSEQEAKDKAADDDKDAQANSLYRQAIKDFIVKLQDAIEQPLGQQPRDQHQDQHQDQQDQSWEEDIEKQLEDSQRSWRSSVINSMRGSRAGKAAMTNSVLTDCGLVKGLKEKSLRVFKGIPYAKPPTGFRRWRPSSALSAGGDGKELSMCWEGTLYATEFGSVCPQVLDPFFKLTEQMDEDCLYLNVYAPTVEAEEAIAGVRGGLPVVVFVHGGGNVEGAGSRYDMSAVADRGFVAVTLNYRLGALGFLATSSLTASASSSGNFALYDIMVALRWVRSNIAAFGGDRTRVTVVGHGAGATNVLGLMIARREKEEEEKLFDRAILLSGGTKIDEKREDAEKRNQEFVDKTACKMFDSSLLEQAECLRDLPLDQVLKFDPFTPTRMQKFSLPTSDEHEQSLLVVDGVLIEESLQQSIAKRKVLPVPMMITVMAEESDFAPAQLISSESDLKMVLQNTLGTLGNFWTEDKGSSSWQKEVESQYPLVDYDSAQQAYEAMVTDVRFLCPWKFFAAQLAFASTHPIYFAVNRMRLREPVQVFALSSSGITAAGSIDEGAGGRARYSFHGLDMMMYMQDEQNFQFSARDAPLLHNLQSLLDHFVTSGSTQGSSYFSTPSLLSYKWKPVTDSPNFFTSEMLATGNVDTAVLLEDGDLKMVDDYRDAQCKLWSNSRVDLLHAAA